jgi:proteasome lid subunit RPN8/RPN11
MISLSNKILEEIAGHGRQDAPNEACGYILGKEGRAYEIIRMENADKSPEHFSFRPQEQFAALKTARSKGLGLIAVYHTHPSSPARMSREDIRLANDPQIIYVIYSLIENRLKCFRVSPGKTVTEEKLEVCTNERI